MDPSKQDFSRMKGRLLSLALALVSLAACVLMACGAAQWFDNLDWGQCEEYASEYSSSFEASGALLSSVPVETSSYPMALVLSQDAVNSLFRRLSNTNLPELSESTEVLGQRLTASIQPEIPLLQIGGRASCPNCIQANVPFDVGLDIPILDLPRGAGAISVQMPIRLVPVSDAQTSLVAEFQSLEVLNLDLNFGSDIADNIFNAVQPLINRALTQFIQNRFQDATILTLDSWHIGQGEVLLAGRGPFVFPNAGTIMVAMQSNLPIEASTRVEAQAQLPAGADIGLVVHPGLLGAMARRMLFEKVIPPSYDEQGNPQPNGNTLYTLQSVGSSDDGSLRASATLFRTGSMCGAADLAASLAFTATPRGVAFAVRDIDVTNGRGSGQVLAQAEQMAGGFLDALMENLEFTVNYDQVFGGEQGEQPQMETFQFNVDGRGLTLYLDLLD